LSATGILRAIAVTAGVSSLSIAGTYTIQAPTISLTPSSVSLTASQTQTFMATVSGASNTAVAWSLTPLVGSISAAGLYTAPASITSAPVVSVTAASVADPLVSASSTVSLVPPVSGSISPGSVSLTPAQTQVFVATVANSSNTAVTWSVSPAVGSISAAGVYTAPVSITSSQTISVAAISVADPTKSAVAMPPCLVIFAMAGFDNSSN